MAKGRSGERLYEAKIRGASPLLMNHMCVSTEPGKKRKTDAQTADKARNEWREKAYFSDELGVYIPNEYIETCIARAATKWKSGKAVLATIFSAETIGFPLTVNNVPRFSTLDDFEKHGWIYQCNARIQKNMICRSRPRVPIGWEATVRLVAAGKDITGTLLEEMLTHAGAYVGIGDWRPKFGRFDVVSFKEVSG